MITKINVENVRSILCDEKTHWGKTSESKEGLIILRSALGHQKEGGGGKSDQKVDTNSTRATNQSTVLACSNKCTE